MEKINKKLYDFFPAAPERWKDFEKLFGERGGCGGCWCMVWRLTRKEFDLNKGNGNKKKMKKIILSGKTPGIIAYQNNEPVGWCSIAPREKFSYLDRSKIFKPVDDKKVWSVTCFFIRKEFQRKGLSVLLLSEAINFVRQKGGKILEGYPYEISKEFVPPLFIWTGIASAFTKAGFTEVVRRSGSRPVMRYFIK